MTMALNKKMVSLLRDPLGLDPLELDGDHLVNRAGQRRYSIIDSIPVLLDPANLGPQNRKIQKMYRWMSRGFDVAERVGNLLMGGAIAKGRRQLASSAALTPGDRCLYTSIGTGLDLPFWAEQVPLETIELVGLDLSIEMLRQCQAKIRPYQETSLLVQANAERLPFAGSSFDVVFHCGGINLFDRPALAVKEMLRVARPGARILIADETKQVVKTQYQKYNPFTRATCKDIPTDFDPKTWVPDGVVNPNYEEIGKGRFYILTFKAPLAQGGQTDAVMSGKIPLG
jgi:ubiquinone/menaquinone biosynthesis C-methylase UbiE